MSVFRTGMIPHGWTAQEWNAELRRVYLGGQGPSEKGKKAGLKRLPFDEPEARKEPEPC